MKIKKIKIRNKNAQVWALDLAIGLMVFVGIIFMFYRYSVSFVPEKTTIEKMIKQGSFVTESLLSQGYPENWNQEPNTISDTTMFGLLDNNSLLDVGKWEKFCGWSQDYYTVVKERLNTDFSFYIFFDKNNDGVGEMIEDCNETGKVLVSGTKQIVKIQRLVAYNDSGQIYPMKMILYLWSNEES